MLEFQKMDVPPTYGTLEEHWFLTHHSYVGAQPFQIILPDILAI